MNAELDAAIVAAFRPDEAGLARFTNPAATDGSNARFDRKELMLGIGPHRALEQLAPVALGGAARLGEAGFLAHMDPPTPWITWVAHHWSARLNQNLLHPDTSPVAGEIERWVIDQLAPVWGMATGLIVPGSTLANLTALWAARERGGVDTIVASDRAHLSIAKAANLLGLTLRTVPTDEAERLDPDALGDLSTAALVLTAGSTSTGSVDPLDLDVDAAWCHVDAAWAGPLRLSTGHRSILDGIERADSVAVSGHKLLFQPKESALVLLADPDTLGPLTFGGGYLAQPNVGLLGSHGAAAGLALAATLLAYGTEGIGSWIDACMAIAAELARLIDADDRLERWPGASCGVVIWRPVGADVDLVASRLDDVTVSVATVAGERWLRSAAANPLADPARVVDAVIRAAETASR